MNTRAKTVWAAILVLLIGVVIGAGIAETGHPACVEPQETPCPPEPTWEQAVILPCPEAPDCVLVETPCPRCPPCLCAHANEYGCLYNLDGDDE